MQNASLHNLLRWPPGLFVQLFSPAAHEICTHFDGHFCQLRAHASHINVAAATFARACTKQVLLTSTHEIRGASGQFANRLAKCLASRVVVAPNGLLMHNNSALKQKFPHVLANSRSNRTHTQTHTKLLCKKRRAHTHSSRKRFCSLPRSARARAFQRCATLNAPRARETNKQENNGQTGSCHLLNARRRRRRSVKS